MIWIRYFSLLILLLILCGGGISQPGESYLVKIIVSNWEDVGELLDERISVLEILMDCVLAKASPEDLTTLDASARSYQIIDHNPEEHIYYLVFINPQCDSIILHQYGEVLGYEGRVAILKTTEERADALPKLKFELKRMRRRPIKWKPKPPYEPSLLINPLIEEIISQVSETDIATLIGDLSGENEVLIGGEPYTIETRYSFTEGCEKASQYIYESFTNMGIEAEYHEYSASYAPNVIATLPGLASPEEIIIICGHYDCTSENPYVDAPGADDNASGTAAVLEAASILSQYNSESTIRFIAFSGEEQGLIGSGYYADQAQAAGDSILAVLNFDMIGYVDYPPEDLDIISNAASEWLADFVIAVADTYTTLQVVKKMSGLSYSDHASFWDEGYSAICGIEDEWPSNPHYHSTSDTLGTLTLSFATDVVKVGLASLASLAHPIPLNEPYVILDDFYTSDIAGGNGDSLTSPGEIIDLSVTLRNLGQVTADSVWAVLRTEDSLVLVSDSLEYFEEIPAESTATRQNAYQFSVVPTCTSGHTISFSLDISATDRQWSANFEILVYAPKIRLHCHAIIDTAVGNGDGVLDPGETAELTITLINSGELRAADVESQITTDDPWVLHLGNLDSFGDILSGSTATQACNLTLDENCPELHTIAFALQISSSPIYSWTDSFELIASGPVFSDDMEGSVEKWSHYAVTVGYYDEWHLSTQRNHSLTHSWKCGHSGVGNYSNFIDAALVTPAIVLPPLCRMTFWHWIDAETYSSTVAWDGGIVEITTDGGESWNQITPVGSYPYTIRSNPDSPFPGGTPCYSGSHTWSMEEFDLSNYPGCVQVRFRFGSDGAVTKEGWYIDDLILEKIPYPDITVNPEEIFISLPPDEQGEGTLTITNDGNLDLDFHITIFTQSDSGWLDAQPLAGSLTPDSTIDVSVTFDASDLESGSHLGELRIHNNDPMDSLLVVPVTLEVLQDQFIRGDVDRNGMLSLSDGLYCFRCQFVPGWGDSCRCDDATDADDNGAISIGDCLRILRKQFVPGWQDSIPPPCCTAPTDCGADPTPDGLGCEEHPCIEGVAAESKRMRSVR